MSALGAGARWWRTEWGRWWRTDDVPDVALAHRVMNTQYRVWMRLKRRTVVEVQQSINLLKSQQRTQRQMQVMQLHAQKQRARRGGYGRYGYGSGFGLGMGGASPFVTYRTMQWSELKLKLGQQEFEPIPLTPGMLAAARDGVRGRRHLKAGLLLLGLPALWVWLWTASVPAAVTVTALAAAVALAAAWSKGSRPGPPRRARVPQLLFVPPKPLPQQELEAEAAPEPFALREAGRDPRAVREAVRLALTRQGAKDEVLVPVQTSYGWRVPLVLSPETAGRLVALLKPLATILRVGEGRITIRPADPDDAALVDLQIITTDPFAHPPAIPYRAPGSCSITEPADLGVSLDGEQTPVILAGQHVIVVGDTGSGKTAIVQRIAEYVTACRDAVLVDVDPVKRGTKALASAAVVTARTPEQAEAVLDDLLARARARIAGLPPTQDTHLPTPDAPAVIAVCDEFPQFSPRGKELAVQLLRIGREALITIVLLTQDATATVLGEAIADAFPVRILMPCRAADVPLVVGRADAVSRGWLPHLLVPSADKDDPADAGRFYCVTPRHREPVLRYVTPLPGDQAARLAKERVAAGLPHLDAPRTTTVPPIAAELFTAFDAHGADVLTVAQIADHLVARDPGEWERWEGRKDRLAMVGRHLRTHLKKAGLTVPTVRADAPSRPTAYRRVDVETACRGLSQTAGDV